MSYTHLSDKRKRFVDAYIGPANCNKSEAARIAGYGCPAAAGNKLCKEPPVRAAIDERMEELAISAREILALLSEQARATMADFITVQEDGSFRIDLLAAEQSGKLRLIRKIGFDLKGRLVLELHDAQAALLALAKRYGLFPERHQLSGPDGSPIPVTAIVDELGEDDVERTGAILRILADCGAFVPRALQPGPAPVDEVRPPSSDGEAGGVSPGPAL